MNNIYYFNSLCNILCFISKKIDLKKDITTFGRRADCDVNLNVDSNLCLATAYSNVHFSIKRVRII